jgi:lipopolysaccharide export system permease protein
MFGNIITRMIMRELCKVFLMSLVGITGLLLMAGIIAEASQQGLGPKQILAAIPLLIPSTLPYTIPATTLFATSVVYGRLAADNEVLAIKSSGVNVLHVVKPGILLGLIMSLVTTGLYYRIIPYSHHLLRAMVFADAEALLYSLLEKNRMVKHPSMPYEMYVKGVQGKKLINPVFKRKGQHGIPDVVANAREADLRVDMRKKEVYLHMRFGVASHDDGSRAYFEDRIWEVPLPPGFGQDNQNRPRDMTWQQIRSKRKEVREKIAALEVKIAAGEEKAPGEGEGEGTDALHVMNLRLQLKTRQQLLNHLYVEQLMRPALSMGCLCFVLVGCPVGIWFSRSDYLSAFITCFLPIVVLYYPLMLCGTNMAKDGRYNQVVMIWGANGVMILIGLVLFRRLMRN